MPKDLTYYLTSSKPDGKEHGNTKRARSSPESGKSTENQQVEKSEIKREAKILKMDSKQMDYFKKDILSAISDLLDSKNYSTKEDIKILENEVNNLRNENNILKMELQELKKRDEERENRLDYLENKSKEKNLIVKGTFEGDIGLSCKDWAQTFVTEKLQADPEIARIDQARFIKNEDAFKIALVTFNNHQAVQEVLSNAKNLRGTNFSVERDLCYNSRKKKGILLAIRKEIKKIKPNMLSYVRNEQLVVNTVKLQWMLGRGLTDTKGSDAVDRLSDLAGQDMKPFIQRLLATNNTANRNDFNNKK